MLFSTNVLFSQQAQYLRIKEFGLYLDNVIDNMLMQIYCCVRKCASATRHLIAIIE